jgi:hypothetical protein
MQGNAFPTRIVQQPSRVRLRIITNIRAERPLRVDGTRSILLACALIGCVSTSLSRPAWSNDCTELYENHLHKLDQKELLPEQRATSQRWALRAFDACRTGDMHNSREIFEKLNKTGLP